MDIVPVTWTHGRQGALQEVWFQQPQELEAALQSNAPFIVALAHPKDPDAEPIAFKEFRGLFEVAPTGRRLSENSIETRVLRRVKAVDEEVAHANRT
jgi:hypothetical protein